MDEFRIVCRNIARTDLGGEYIGEVGVLRPDGSIEVRAQTAVIDDIQKERYKYYVKASTGLTAYCTVGISANHNYYLTTVADGAPIDNLLSLPDCPTTLHKKGKVDPDDLTDWDAGGDVDPGGPDSDVDTGTDDD
jgi:hypothetical protein